MSEIQGGRWDELLRRFFPVKGTSVAPSIAPELQPIVVVQPYRMAMRALASDKMFGGRWSRGPVAGQYSMIILENPASSQLLAEVQRILLWNTAANVDCYIGWEQTQRVSSQSSTFPLDSRLPRGTGVNATCDLLTGTTAAPVVSTFGVLHCLQDIVTEWKDPILVHPGQWLAIRSGSVNEQISGSMIWSEVPASPAELTLGY